MAIASALRYAAFSLRALLLVIAGQEAAHGHFLFVYAADTMMKSQQERRIGAREASLFIMVDYTWRYNAHAQGADSWISLSAGR